ncbi:MAG: fimbrial assembly protein [Methylocystis sp.]|nr:MAG: fimbrial assembly protein [Methylocystis sp.]
MSFSSDLWTRDVLGGSLKAGAARFFAWYRDAFLTLFPAETAAWLIDRGDRELILRDGDSNLWFLDSEGAPVWSLSSDEIAASSLDESLARHGVTRKTAKIGMEIDGSAFFVRRFDIPSAAAANLSKLIVADIERKTPFHLADVVYGHTVAKHPASADKLRVSMWILRRDILLKGLENAGLAVSDLAFLRPSGVSPAAGPPPIIVLEGKRETSHVFRNMAVGLGAVAALLFAVGIGATLWRQKALGEELDARIEEMSARAAKVRQIADRAAAESRLLSVLRKARRNGPLFADLWEETARILPDGAFVTDMRLTEPRANERVLEIVGFADSAAGLPALFEKSPLFAKAGLSAPITPDPHEKREGFSLQATIEAAK